MTPVPSAAAMLSRRSFRVPDPYASRSPSGDHTGSRSLPVAVVTRTRLPSWRSSTQMSGLPRAGSIICRAIRLPSGDSRGQPCCRGEDSRTPVPSRATVPSRTPYGIGVVTVASSSGRCTQHRRVVRRVRPRGHWQRRGSPTSLSAAASKGRACNWPSAAESSTPCSRPDVGDEHRFRFRSEERRTRYRRGPVDARDVHAAPLIGAGPDVKEHMDAVRQERRAIDANSHRGRSRRSVAGSTAPPSADTLASPSKIRVGAEHDRARRTPRAAPRRPAHRT